MGTGRSRRAGSPRRRRTAAVASRPASSGSARSRYGVLFTEAKLARRTVGTPFEQAPPSPTACTTRAASAPADPGHRRRSQLAVLGDSTAAGLGVDHAGRDPGRDHRHRSGRGLGRTVRLVNVAVSGAQSRDLADQVERRWPTQPRRTSR